MPSSSTLRSFDDNSATATQPNRNVALALEAEALASAGQYLRRNVNISPRIYGGEDAKDDRFPYYVALVDNNMNLVCGGSLIASDMVLTAAHCK
jgi:secreted trypsin-like serine protease